MAAIWEKGQGCNGVEESAEAYFRFVRFLHLGSQRSCAALARLLGLTQQAVSYTARRYNWEKRAAAFDKARRRGKAQLPDLVPPEAPPPDPPRTTPPSRPPRPPRPPRAVIPEVLQPDPDALALSLSHTSKLADYQAQYERIGGLMADEAEALYPLITQFRDDVQSARAAWRQLLDAKEIQLAQTLCLQLQALVPLYFKLSEAMHLHANGGRTHRGDALGIARLLGEMTKEWEAEAMGGGKG